MPTDKQKLGIFGEDIVAKNLICQKCKNKKSFREA